MNSEQRLIEAIVAGRIYQTRILLELGAKAEFLDDYGFSPLLRACQIEDYKRRTRTVLIKLLIEYGADVNTKDPQGHHALSYACLTSKEDIVSLLLDMSLHDINLNQRDTNGNTPLFHAIRSGNLKIVKLLISSMNKFDINMHFRNNADRTPYLEAVMLGRTECARILLEEGHASSGAQVNPFLGFSPTEKTCDTLWKKIEDDQQRDQNEFVCQTASAKTQCSTSYQSNRGALLKRNQNSIKKCRETIVPKDVEPQRSLDSTGIPKIDHRFANDQNTLMNRKCVHTIEMERITNAGSQCTSSVFLTDNGTHFIPRHLRAKTAPPKSRRVSPGLAPGVVTDDDRHITPSMNYFNIIMTLYGEQCSPDSSYRKSVKPRMISDNTPAGLEHEHDKPSEGRRSSSGSVRSLSGAGRTKFSAILNRVAASSISSKKISGNRPRI